MNLDLNLPIKWTEELAYLMGFWFADGCIRLKSKSSNIRYKRFQIDNTDKQIIIDLARILDVSYQTCKPRKANWKICYRIDIRSDELFDFCYSIGGMMRKSSNPINLPKISPTHFHHFVRGYFDGDGSIYYVSYKNRHGKPTFQLGSSFAAGSINANFLEQLRDKLIALVGTGKKKIVGKNGKKLTFGQYDTYLLCEWMYRGATVYMKRKRNIWDGADKNKILKSKIYFSNKV